MLSKKLLEITATANNSFNRSVNQFAFQMPDEYLDELYQVIRDFEVKKEGTDSQQSVMARLRQIRISASPDFSVKASLYSLEDKNAK